MGFKTGLTIGIIIGILGGMLLGTYLQQMILRDIVVNVVDGLKGTIFDIGVSLNETIIVEKMKDVFVPILNNTKGGG